MVNDGDDKYGNADDTFIAFFAEDWTLQIAPVLLEDDALFQCQVTPLPHISLSCYLKLSHMQSLPLVSIDFKKKTSVALKKNCIGIVLPS